MKTIRRSIALTKPQLKWLNERAKTLGVTVADVVRRIIDGHREQPKEAVKIIRAFVPRQACGCLVGETHRPYCQGRVLHD